MKVIITLAIIFVLCHCDLIDKGSWIADTDNKFAGMSVEELRQYTGTIIAPYSENIPYNDDFAGDVPQDFDARTQWPTCIHPIRDQEQCGSCWAFGASESFSDRVCIATKGKSNVVLSPEDLVSCDTGNYGCGGGYLNVAWEYIVSDGLVSDACFPYSAGNGTAPACATKCATKQKWTVYKADNVQALSATAGQTEIMTNGPIETAFDVYEDFFSYSSGVYVQNSTQLVGGHAIKVLGWGYDNSSGLNYWLAANSWGADWGMEGFFEIAWGQCQFDSNFIAGDYASSHTLDEWLE